MMGVSERDTLLFTEGTMKIKILKPITAKGLVRGNPEEGIESLPSQQPEGAVIDCSSDIAQRLVRDGLAKKVVINKRKARGEK
jgi:hypothetical protein